KEKTMSVGVLQFMPRSWHMGGLWCGVDARSMAPREYSSLNKLSRHGNRSARLLHPLNKKCMAEQAHAF
ncbi:MAG: hypothetical protein WAU37_06260, partial [Formosimonas sp.]